jgi:hypothetical protein
MASGTGRISVWRVLRLTVPLIRQSVAEFAKARALDSEAGREITAQEWEKLAMEIGLRIGESIYREIKLSGEVLDAE